jgi:Sec-independent protein translocase protein TatA
MLDNLGLGEFFFLALLALLFFGPERLPRIGAQLGHWVRSLTQYSSAFLNEWREEALAVQDAVEQVKGIRDEIVAARSEITGTLAMARTDMSDAVSGATREVEQQVQGSTQILADQAAPPTETSPPTVKSIPDAKSAKGGEKGASEGGAVARTQEILDDLLARRETAQEGPLQSTLTMTEELSIPDAKRYPAMSHSADFVPANVEQLRVQVDALRVEMEALRQEMARFRAGTAQEAVHVAQELEAIGEAI